MKILQVVDDFPPCIAGDGIHVYHISKELAKRCHQVTVFTTIKTQNTKIFLNNTLKRKTSPSIDEKEISGIKVHYFRPFLRISYFSITPRLFMAIFRQDFDLVHVHRYFSLQSPIVMLISKLKKKPIIFTPHSTTTREKKSVFAALLKKIFDNTLGRLLLECPDVIIALTPENIKDFLNQRVKPHKIKLIPNGIDLKKFNNLPEPSIFKKKYGIDGKIILFVGRLVKYKGVQYILESAPKILEFQPNTKFVIVGPDYGYKGALTKMAEKLNLQKSVIFTGGVSDRELLEAYAAADIFVLPSIHEGFGLVLLEAMACKKPVVTWKTSAMQYVVKNKKSGILVDPFNLEDFVKAIILLLSDKKLAEKMGAEGRKIVERNFRWDYVVDALEKAYNMAIANRFPSSSLIKIT